MLRLVRTLRVAAHLSTPELEHFERLKRTEREVLKIGERDGDTLATIEAAEYGRPGRGEYPDLKACLLLFTTDFA
ncbi:hypothetical protein [Mesorhizobium sp. CN2-181]|uniref:hypothetical protein n=1 Tax=Mesorhizobium yinganensis TaxID=3157707 RepID=UPI0032B70919